MLLIKLPLTESAKHFVINFVMAKAKVLEHGSGGVKLVSLSWHADCDFCVFRMCLNMTRYCTVGRQSNGRLIRRAGIKNREVYAC